MHYKFFNNFSPEVRKPKLVFKETTALIELDNDKRIYGFHCDSEEPELYDVTSAITGNQFCVGRRYVRMISAVKIIGISYDMSANHNFGYVVTKYYALSPKDTFEIVDRSVGPVKYSFRINCFAEQIEGENIVPNSKNLIL